MCLKFHYTKCIYTYSEEWTNSYIVRVHQIIAIVDDSQRQQCQNRWTTGYIGSRNNLILITKRLLLTQSKSMGEDFVLSYQLNAKIRWQKKKNVKNKTNHNLFQSAMHFISLWSKFINNIFILFIEASDRNIGWKLM